MVRVCCTPRDSGGGGVPPSIKHKFCFSYDSCNYVPTAPLQLYSTTGAICCFTNIEQAKSEFIALYNDQLETTVKYTGRVKKSNTPKNLANFLILVYKIYMLVTHSVSCKPGKLYCVMYTNNKTTLLLIAATWQF